MDNTNHLRTIHFGKFKGKTFAEVYEYKDYCEWILTKGKKEGWTNYNEFYDYIIKRNISDMKP